MRRQDIYDPFDIYADLEKERLEEVRKRNAINTNRTKSDEKHEEAIQVKEESEVGVLRLDQQGKTRVRKVARVKKGQWVLGIDGKYHRRSKRTKPKAERAVYTAKRAEAEVS